MAMGMIGRKGFDPAKEIAKEYPHKWNSGTLYRDFLRVIMRKYEEPLKTKYLTYVRSAFREHGYVDSETRMKLMGTGPTSLGSLAIEEEFYEKGIKHPENPSRYDMIDIFSLNLDCKRIHPLPYLIQRDVWYYFGLGEQQQDVIATKIHRICKKYNDKYTEKTVQYRDQCREFIVNRLDLFESSYANTNINQTQTQSTSISLNDANKIKEIFQYLDNDNDGYITYANMFKLLCNDDYDDNDELFTLYNVDNIKLCTESWYYMSDMLYSLNKFICDNPQESELEIELTQKQQQHSYKNPLYKKWNLEQLTDAYIKYKFFDIDHHHSLLTNNSNINNDNRIYNLFSNVSINIPSIYLIAKDNLASGEYLYHHILNADDDPYKVTWEKLEEIHQRMGTLDVIKTARENEEIDPQDVLYYDPDQCTSDIPNGLPDYSIFWQFVYENQMPELQDYMLQEYFDEHVTPDIMKENDGIMIEPKNVLERDKMIEQHVYDEIEKWMQPWLWKRYAQDMKKPPFSISTWENRNLLTHIRQ